VILACTNLPKEIESRVIFTIVTKPTTRLEIVLGKVLGFAAISGLILLIMGGFTFAYAEARAWSLGRQIRQALAANTVADGPEKARLQRYADGGLLGTKAVRWPDDLQVYARDPKPGDDTRWILGGQTTYMVVPFVLTEADQDKLVQAVKAGGTPAVVVTLKIDPRKLTTEYEREEIERGGHPVGEQNTFGPSLPTTGPSLPVPRVTMVAYNQANSKQVASNELSLSNPVSALPDRSWQPGGTRRFVVPLRPNPSLAELLEAGRFNLEVSGITPTLEYGAGRPNRCSSSVPRGRGRGGGGDVVGHRVRSTRPPTTGASPRRPPSSHPRRGARGSTRGSAGSGCRRRPPPEEGQDVAATTFRGETDISPGFRRQGRAADEDQPRRAGDLDGPRKTSRRSPRITLGTRTDRAGGRSGAGRAGRRAGSSTCRLPAAAVAGRRLRRCQRSAGLTPGQYLGLHGMTATIPSVAVVQAEQSFAVNLVKALLVLWMLSTLVVAIAVFTSTFLSWPIAIVLTVLLLLGRWGVDQLGESLNAGASRNIAQELFRMRDASGNKVVTDIQEGLSATLRTVAPVLPDVGRFPVVEDLDRGVSIPAAKVMRALQELLVYGVPLVLLTYLILRNKEVAP
jgi:hypothetical protein